MGQVLYFYFWPIFAICRRILEGVHRLAPDQHVIHKKGDGPHPGDVEFPEQATAMLRPTMTSAMRQSDQISTRFGMCDLSLDHLHLMVDGIAVRSR